MCGYFFLLNKLEKTIMWGFTQIVEKGVVVDAKDCKEKFTASDELMTTIKEMREVFEDTLAAYRESEKAYEDNAKRGFYSKGFGLIEGWFLKNVYLKNNIKRYTGYLSRLDKIEPKLSSILTKLRFLSETKYRAN